MFISPALHYCQHAIWIPQFDILVLLFLCIVHIDSPVPSNFSKQVGLQVILYLSHNPSLLPKLSFEKLSWARMQKMHIIFPMTKLLEELCLHKTYFNCTTNAKCKMNLKWMQNNEITTGTHFPISNAFKQLLSSLKWSIMTLPSSLRQHTHNNLILFQILKLWY